MLNEYSNSFTAPKVWKIFQNSKESLIFPVVKTAPLLDRLNCFRDELGLVAFGDPLTTTPTTRLMEIGAAPLVESGEAEVEVEEQVKMEEESGGQ